MRSPRSGVLAGVKKRAEAVALLPSCNLIWMEEG